MKKKSKRTFRFFVDKKIEVWERSTYMIPADTYKQALKKAKKLFESEEDNEKEEYGLYNTETLYDSAKDISSENNITRELTFSDRDDDGRWADNQIVTNLSK